jgi:hypothetical protein
MEARGRVNCYEAVGFGRQPIYVINLSTGVTPCVHFFDGQEPHSLCYQVRKPVLLTVEYAHYRPTREKFDTLEPGVKYHVTNGGLCLSKLANARPLANDPVNEEWEYEEFQEFCLKTYGQRRKRM